MPHEAQKGCPSATCWLQDQQFAGALTLSIICIGADPDFLYAAQDTTACAAFIKESRMNLDKANKLPGNPGKQTAARLRRKR